MDVRNLRKQGPKSQALTTSDYTVGIAAVVPVVNSLVNNTINIAIVQIIHTYVRINCTILRQNKCKMEIRRTTPKSPTTFLTLNK